MSKLRVIGSCEVIINTALKRISKLEGQNKEALKEEFREWLDAVECGKKNYDVLYIKKID